MTNFTKVVLFTGSDGRARFREDVVPLDEGTPQTRLSALLPNSAPIRTIIPAVTCSVQSTYLTGRLRTVAGFSAWPCAVSVWVMSRVLASVQERSRARTRSFMARSGDGRARRGYSAAGTVSERGHAARPKLPLEE